MKIDMILPSAGSSTRFESDIKKQFYMLDSEPVIVRTVKQCLQCSFIDRIIVVAAESDMEKTENLFENYNNVDCTTGGPTRSQSVINGLEASDSDMVFVHDGARPFIDRDFIEDIMNAYRDGSIVMPYVRPVETVRYMTESSINSLDRDRVMLIQTPQYTSRALLLGIMKDALTRGIEFTDEAGFMADAGREIIPVKGRNYNIKITKRSDILLGESILKELM